MIHSNLLRRCVLGCVVACASAAGGLIGCSPAKTPATSSQDTSWNLGVLHRIEDPAEVAKVRTFYVAPNNQLAMRNSFTVRSSLAQAFADQIAIDLTKQGLVQGPPDMVDATVIFTVDTPKSPPPDQSLGGPAQGLGYADQLLSDADALQANDNFLQDDRVDMRIKILDTKTQKVIWRGSIAGVQAANHGSRGRMLDMLDAVDRLMKNYPKVPK